MALTSKLYNFKYNASSALEYAEDLKGKLSITNELLSKGVILNGKALCSDQIIDNINRVNMICSNLKELISYCANNSMSASQPGKDAPGRFGYEVSVSYKE